MIYYNNEAGRRDLRFFFNSSSRHCIHGRYLISDVPSNGNSIKNSYSYLESNSTSQTNFSSLAQTTILLNQNSRGRFKQFLLTNRKQCMIFPKRLYGYANPTGAGVVKLITAMLFGLFTMTGLSTTAHATLSATTANTIQGTRPYIELNGIEVTDSNILLSINVGGDTYVSNSSGAMNKVLPDGTLTPVTIITLPNVGDQFDSVNSLVAPDTTSYSLNDIAVIPLSSRKDDDGDGNLTITGNLKGEWLDKNGHSIGSDLTKTPSSCDGPYTLTLTMTNNPSISSQYGDPRLTTYGNGSAIFRIASQPSVCYAKPNIVSGTGNYAGPATMWDTTKGFKAQSTNPTKYDQNFPTTGANNLYFDLEIGGVSTALTWPSVTVGNVTATMSNITNTSVRVTLTGPDVIRHPYHPEVALNSSAQAFTPTQIELVGESGGTAVVKYGFKIKKWYVHRRLNSVEAYTSWCNGLHNSGNYALAKVQDLTTASGFTPTGAPIPSVPFPNSAGNNYWRHIGGGLFSEWGDMASYFRSGFYVRTPYWTSDMTGVENFLVNSHDGNVTNADPAIQYSGICTQP